MTYLPLKLNDSNEYVRKLHSMLEILQYPIKNITDYFNQNTKKIVTSFQNDFGLKTTGIVDIDTWNALVDATKKDDDSSIVETTEQIHNDDDFNTSKQQNSEILDTNPLSTELPDMQLQNEQIIEIPEINIEPQFINDMDNIMGYNENFYFPEINKTKETVVRPNLMIGDINEHVIELQRKLAHMNYYTEPITDVFNSDTEIAVKVFQIDNKLTPNGKVNSQTWLMLGLMK